MSKLRDIVITTAALFSMAFGSATHAADVVKIGQIEAQTGPTAAYGFMGVRGAAMAVNEINRNGGFKVAGKTYQLELLAPDTRGDPKEALVHIKRLVEQEKVKFVLGPSSSGVFASVAPYAERVKGQFLWLNNATRGHAYLEQPGHDFYLRTWNWISGKDGIGTRLTEYVVKTLAPKKIAVLFPDTEGARATAEVLVGIFKGANLDYVIEYYDSSQKDFGPSLSKLTRQGADVLVPGIGDAEASVTDMVRQAVEGNYFKRFVAYNGGLLGPALRNKDLIESYIFDTPKYFPEAEKSEPKTRQFIADYKATYKEDFPYSQAPTCVGACYDHIYMLVEAMQKAGSVEDTARIRKAILESGHEGLWRLAYDAKGEQLSDFDIVHVKKGGAIMTERVKVVKR